MRIQLYRPLKNRIERAVLLCDPPNRPAMMDHLTSPPCGRTSRHSDQLRLTRVFSFMPTSPTSTHVFSNLNVPDGMHKTCHDGHWERFEILLYQMEAFAGFCDAFATEHPTGGTLLDRGLITGRRNTARAGNTASKNYSRPRRASAWASE